MKIGSRPSLLPLLPALVACGLAPASLGAAESVSGLWKVLVTQEGSQRDYYLELKQDGEKVAGIFRSPRSGEYPFEGGSFDGKKLRVDVSRKLGERTAVYAIDAEIVAPEKLEGKLLIDGNESGSVAVTRQGSIVQGRWKVVTKTAEGREYVSTLVLLEVDGALRGRSINGLGTFELQDPKFEKDALSFGLVLSIRGTEVPLVLEAKLENADSLVGRWKTKEEQYAGDWSATRTVESEASPSPPDPKLAGKWYGIATRPDLGEQAFELELSVEDGRASAEFRIGDGEFEVRDLRASGGRVQGAFQHREGGLELRVTIEGELQGESLRGRWTAETGESGDWSARQPIRL